MRRFIAAALVLLTGCGVPQERARQAEQLHSLAAEGALLAHDAAEGTTTGVFARVHSRALREQVVALRGAIRDPRLAAHAARVERELARLPAAPAAAERALGAAAEELAP